MKLHVDVCVVFCPYQSVYQFCLLTHEQFDQHTGIIARINKLIDSLKHEFT